MTSQTSLHSFILTIFGASGDLAKLKLFPAIFALAKADKLPEDFLIVGFARSKKTRKEFQKEFSESIEAECKKQGDAMSFCQKACDKLVSHVFYFAGTYDELSSYEEYRDFLAATMSEQGIKTPKTHIAYFSVPPQVFQPILENLGKTRTSESDDIRIVLEKPFGEDSHSARKLFHFLSRYFDESQVFLLDHYLGKRAVQSILSLRHNNSILNTLLKGNQIASIQITAHETVGLEDRIGYFDHVGIIKDMFQSHLTQILAMVTMSIPIGEDAEGFHREKESILSALDFSPRQRNLYLGQYDGYQSLDGVREESRTETYFAVKLKIDRESWYGVPIFVRTGKYLAKKCTMVVVEFKKLPFQKGLEPNRLVFELQPEERLQIKLLGQEIGKNKHEDITTSESLVCTDESCLPEHAALLLDVFRDDKLHFLSFPEILAQWEITDKILSFAEHHQMQPETYEQGVDMPEGAGDIFLGQHEKWFVN